MTFLRKQSDIHLLRSSNWLRMTLADPDSSVERDCPTFCGRNRSTADEGSKRRGGRRTRLTGGGGIVDDGEGEGDASPMLMQRTRLRRRRRRRKPPVDDSMAEAVPGTAFAGTESSRLSDSLSPSSSSSLSHSTSSAPSSSTPLFDHPASPKPSSVAARLFSTPPSPATAVCGPSRHPPGRHSGLPLGRRPPSPASPLRHWLFLVVLLIASATAYINDELVVQTNKGKVRGVTLKSATQRNVDVWYGIPYAKPPVGNLRFRHPHPIDKWDNVLETTKMPNTCVQVMDTMFPGFWGSEMWNANTPMSEDCLYINVAVPQPHPENSAVLVWIYGGGFYSGSSTLEVYDPKILATEENIIVVSFQYRVASLGFLFFDTEDVPGNAGLFDQLMALQWIKDNIAQFGGNPENITIFGESAGAASVGLHLLSPLSRNLFAQAILQSASPVVPWGVITKEESVLRTMRLAETVKCPSDKSNPEPMIQCLRQKNATQLVNNEWLGITVGICEFPFVPIIDGSFLDETPQTALEAKNFKKTNVLLGANRDEGFYFILYYLTELFKKEENVFVTRNDFLKAVKELNLYVKPVGREAIVFEYTDWLNPKDPLKNRDALDRMVGDYAFTCPVMNFAHRFAETGNNVYAYFFSERGSTVEWPSWAGVLHGYEIPFIFGEPLDKSKNYDQFEIKLSKRMMAYWANFAKTGNPSLSADGTWTTTYWPLHTPHKREILELNANFSRIVHGHRVKKCAFWKKFLPRLTSLDSPRPCDKSCCEAQQLTVIDDKKNVAAPPADGKAATLAAATLTLLLAATLSD